MRANGGKTFLRENHVRSAGAAGEMSRSDADDAENASHCTGVTPNPAGI
jgi:hypothetical protein